MKILQMGAPKCGNFWLYKIIEGILNRSGLNQPNFIQQQPVFQLAKHWELNYPEQAEIDMIDITDLQTAYRISSIYRIPIDDMADYISQTNHVWTHSPICKSSGKVFGFFDKKICIIRDPRDRLISASKYYCSPYMLKFYPQPEKNPEKYLEKHFEELMKNWIWHVFDHLRFSEKYNLHLVFYESLLIDFQKELNKLLTYLTIELKEREKESLEKEVSFSSMKKDNPKHLKKGIFGYWKEQLNEEQKEKASLMAAPLLKLLKYDDLSEKNTFHPPQHFNMDFEILKQEIIETLNSLPNP